MCCPFREALMKRIANAAWKGSVRLGEGTVSTSSGVISRLIYTAGANSGDIPCITPTEMLAAAEASCIAVSVAREFEKESISFDSIETKAEVNIEARKKAPEITGIHLDVTVHATDTDPAVIEKALHRAKQHCIITRNLSCKVTMTTHVNVANGVAATA